MKKTFITIGITLMTASFAAAQDWANFGRFAEENKTAPRGADAVLMGNSITEGWAYEMPEFVTGNGYVNRGIGGQVTAQMLARFRPDVIDLAPKSVVILAGTNDIAGNQGDISLENIRNNIISMAELAKYNGIPVIICSVLPAYEYRWSPDREPAGKIVELNAMLREYAEANGCVYADLHTAMKDSRNGLADGLHSDEVHLTRAGYEKMASLLKPIIDKTIGNSVACCCK